MGKNTTRSFYSRWSSVYTLLFDNPPIIRKIRRETVDLLDLEQGDKVFEIGCGTGANFRYLREKVGSEGKVVGIDLSPGMLDKARRKVERNEWENIELIEGDGAKIELDEEFDAVLFSFSIGMFQNPEGVIEKWSHNIDDGRICIVDGSKSEKTLGEILNFLSTAFTVLTAPPLFKIRYEDSLGGEERLSDVRNKLRELSSEVKEKKLLYGIVKIESGKIE